MNRINRFSVFEHNSEFVAAQAGHKTEAIRELFETVGHAHQYAISKHVADAVVNVLKIIDIQEVNSHETVISSGPIDRRVQQKSEVPAIGEGSQRILQRQLLQT